MPIYQLSNYNSTLDGSGFIEVFDGLEQIAISWRDSDKPSACSFVSLERINYDPSQYAKGCRQRQSIQATEIAVSSAQAGIFPLYSGVA